MKYKYKLIKDNEKKQLIIQEYIELESEIPFLACEETYDLEKLENILHNGKNTLKNVLRSKNIYPPGNCLTSLEDIVTKMLINSDSENSLEINFDDKQINFETKKQEDHEKDDVGVDIDKLLKLKEDTPEIEESKDKISIKN